MHTLAGDIGFVGLGVMGGAMCANLARHSGRKVHGHDRNAQNVARYAGSGVLPCDDMNSIKNAAEILFLCLPNPQAVEDVCLDVLAAPGRVRAIVDCSTTSLSKTRELANRLEQAGIAFADAPVARMREAAINGTLCIMVGATAALFDAIKPLLSCMGSDILHCGPVGSGQIVKILNNMVLISNVHALASALGTARNLGVDGEVLYDALSKGSADSMALRRQGMGYLLTGNFPQGTFPSLYARKDIGLAEELFSMADIDQTQLMATATLLDNACDAGLADIYYPAFIEVLDRRTRKPAATSAGSEETPK